MIGWHHQLNGHEFEQTLGGSEGQRSLAWCSPWGHKESDKVERLNKSNNKHTNSSLMGQCSVCLSKQAQHAYLSLCCPICIHMFIISKGTEFQGLTVCGSSVQLSLAQVTAFHLHLSILRGRALCGCQNWFHMQKEGNAISKSKND